MMRFTARTYRVGGLPAAKPNPRSLEPRRRSTLMPSSASARHGRSGLRRAPRSAAHDDRGTSPWGLTLLLRTPWRAEPAGTILAVPPVTDGSAFDGSGAYGSRRRRGPTHEVETAGGGQSLTAQSAAKPNPSRQCP